MFFDIGIFLDNITRYQHFVGMCVCFFLVHYSANLLTVIRLKMSGQSAESKKGIAEKSTQNNDI